MTFKTPKGRPLLEDRQRASLIHANRRLQVAKLFLAGNTMTEIARQLGVNKSTVSRDLALSRKEWAAEHPEKVEEARMKMLAQLDWIMTELWEAWEKSKKLEVTKIIETVPTSEGVEGGKDGKAKAIKRRHIRKTQCGNPAYLQGIERCLERRCKLLGIEPPQKIDANIKEDTTANWMAIIQAMDATIGTPDQADAA